MSLNLDTAAQTVDDIPGDPIVPGSPAGPGGPTTPKAGGPGSPRVPGPPGNPGSPMENTNLYLLNCITTLCDHSQGIP